MWGNDTKDLKDGLQSPILKFIDIKVIGNILEYVGASDGDIAELIKTAMWHKLENGWQAQKAGEEQRNSMTQIGG